MKTRIIAPLQGETKETFLNRCMNDESLKAFHPNSDKRKQYLESMWSINERTGYADKMNAVSDNKIVTK
jgi:hypothetical protein